MEQPKKRRLGRWLLLFLIVFLVVVAKLAINFANHPANGKVLVGASKAAPNSYAIDLTPVAFNGAHMSFKYPRGLKQYPPNELGANDVEKASFRAKDIESWSLNIDITSTGGQSLSGDSSYALRKLHPETYDESRSNLGGQSVDIMTNKTVGGFEKVAYLQSGAYRATVSLVGDDADGTTRLQESFNMVLSSWQWR